MRPTTTASVTISSIRSCAALVMTGPMSLFGSLPGATRTFSAAAFSRSSRASATSSTTSATEIAMHRSPAAPNAAPVRCVAARSRSASASTTAWFLAPPRACTRFPWAVAVAWTCFAIGVDPTNDTAETSGCVSSPSTATRSPCSTEKTPSGSPAAFQRRASRSDDDGSRSDGLSTNALPVAMAMGAIHSGTIAGKLNGVMPATTPSGSRNENTSTPVAAWSVYSPLSSCGMPHAYSTTSSPRPTSPSESAVTLPCSAVIVAASSSVCATSCSRNANSTPARFPIGSCAQACDASSAPATTASTSAWSASRTRPVTSPVAGLRTSCVRDPSGVVTCPPTT